MLQAYVLTLSYLCLQQHGDNIYIIDMILLIVEYCVGVNIKFDKGPSCAGEMTKIVGPSSCWTMLAICSAFVG